LKQSEVEVGMIVTVNGSGDLMMDGELRPIIGNGIELFVAQINKGGLIRLTINGSLFYNVPARNLDLVSYFER
jgi:hypothetical protein